MIDYEKIFMDYCAENGLAISLSYDMPAGYENANGMFDPAVNTLFINKDFLKDLPDYEQMFYLFHELRHALQYLCSERFDARILKSRQYVIMYDGHCYKLVQEEWKECVLEGSTEYFSALYFGQPYEADANEFAYEKVKSICGESVALDDLHFFGFQRYKSQIVNMKNYMPRLMKKHDKPANNAHVR